MKQSNNHLHITHARPKNTRSRGELADETARAPADSDTAPRAAARATTRKIPRRAKWHRIAQAAPPRAHLSDETCAGLRYAHLEMSCFARSSLGPPALGP